MSGESLGILVLDTSYLMPAFGVEIDIDSSRDISDALEALVRQGCRVFLSDLSPLEGFLKAFRLAEKGSNEEGKNAARSGFLAVAKNSSTFSFLSHADESVLTNAFEIMKSHKDPFDCFIFATAIVLGATLVTEDDSARRYVSPEKTLSWKKLRRIIEVSSRSKQ